MLSTALNEHKDDITAFDAFHKALNIKDLPVKIYSLDPDPLKESEELRFTSAIQPPDDITRGSNLWHYKIVDMISYRDRYEIEITTKSDSNDRVIPVTWSLQADNVDDMVNEINQVSSSVFSDGFGRFQDDIDEIMGLYDLLGLSRSWFATIHISSRVRVDDGPEPDVMVIVENYSSTIVISVTDGQQMIVFNDPSVSPVVKEEISEDDLHDIWRFIASQSV